MLLKDCPVGSVVRLDSLCGNPFPEQRHTAWDGCFAVMIDKGCKYVIDGDGDKRDNIWFDPDYQFEIVRPAPEPTPEPRITFTVGGQEFYVGQRVWSVIPAKSEGCEIRVGDEMIVCGRTDLKGRLTLRHAKTNICSFGDWDSVSTTPPTPHEWRRGDWARHEDGTVYLVAHVFAEKIVLTRVNLTTDGTLMQANPRDPKLTFISHAEIPE